MEGSFLNPMHFHPVFTHIIGLIFEQLDEKSLSTCRIVAKSWQKYIDNKNNTWIQIVNAPRILEDENTYLHLSAKTGQTKMFEKILEKEDVKNPKNQDGETPFHVVCKYGHLKMADKMILMSTEFNMNLNTKNNRVMTPFDLACREGQLQIMELLLQKSVDFNIELNGSFNFYFACVYGNSEVAKFLIQKSVEFDTRLLKIMEELKLST